MCYIVKDVIIYIGYNKMQINNQSQATLVQSSNMGNGQSMSTKKIAQRKKSESVNKSDNKASFLIKQQQILNNTLQQNDYDQKSQVKNQNKFNVNQLRFEKKEAQRNNKIGLAQTLLSNNSPRASERSNSNLKNLLGLDDDIDNPKQINLKLNVIKDNQDMLMRQKKNKQQPNSTLNRDPSKIIFEMQVKDENGNLRPLQRLERSASGGTILPDQIIAQSNPFGKSKKSILTVKQAHYDNLQAQKIQINQKWMKQPLPRKLSVVSQHQESNMFPQLNQNSKIRNQLNINSIHNAHNQSLDQIYNIVPQKHASQVFQGMSTIQEKTLNTDPISPRLQNQQLLSPTPTDMLQQQQASHQINLSIGKLHKTRLKQAIQKQIVEYAQRHQGIQELQDMYQKRQLVAKPKVPEMSQANKNKIKQQQQIITQQNEYQKILMDNYNEKSKRIDFIQKLINQSKQKQSNIIKYDKAYTEQMNNVQQFNLVAAQMELENLSKNIFYGDQLNQLDSNQYLVNQQNLESLAQSNGNNLKHRRNSPNNSQLDQYGSRKPKLTVENNYRIVDMQNKLVSQDRQQSFFSPQPSKKSNASNFFGGESTSVNSAVKSIRFENTMSAMSMMNQMNRDNSNSRMSKIIEGLAKKDSELHLKTEDEALVQNQSSSKKGKGNTERYIDININTNLRQYNSDSENLQMIKGKNPNIQFTANQAHPQSKQFKYQQGSKLRLPSAILDKDQFLKLKSVQAYLSPQFQNMSRQQAFENYDSMVYPNDGLEIQGEPMPYSMDQTANELQILKEKLKQSSTIDMAWLQSQQQPVPKKYYYNKNSSIQTSHELRLEAEKNLKETEITEYRELFAKLGLNFDQDVPKEIREQLKFDKNAKQILVDLGNELEQNGEVNYLKRYLQGESAIDKQKNFKTKQLNVSASNTDVKIKKSIKTVIASLPKVDPMAESQTLNPNACFAVNPGEPTLIKILNEPIKKHQQHPINKTLKLINDFCFLTMVKAANYRGTQQKSALFDNINIQNLAKQLKIDIPKNQNANELQMLFKSKQFIVTCKGQILQKLFHLMNKENDIELNFERSQFQFYKGFVGKGNNAPLIVSLFKQHRWWWTIFQSISYDENGDPILPYSAQQQIQNQMLNMQLYKESFIEHNFLWTQWKKLKHFQYLKTPTPEELQNQQQKAKEQAKKEKEEIGEVGQENNNGNIDKNQESPDKNEGQNLSNSIKVYAKLENNYHLSNKYALFYNMRKYYKALGRDPFEVLPLTFHVKKGVNDPEYLKFLQMHKMYENERQQACKEEKDLVKKIEILEQDIVKVEKKLDRLSQSLTVSEYVSEVNSEYNRKNSKENSKNQSKASSFLPDVEKKNNEIIIDEKLLRKMHVQKKQNVIEQERIQRDKKRTQEHLNDCNQQLEKVDQLKQQKNIWIVKPGENTNRGVGISVQTKVKDIQDIVKSEGGNSQKTFIIQKYIETPALYKLRKFDIRCFALVQSVNGHLKGFNYEDGYLRTCGREYNLKTFNKFIHLTNDAVQKRSEDYGRFEFGNKVSFQEYQQYLNQTVPHLNIDFRLHIFSQIKRLQTDTIRACYKIIDPNKRQHSFEILGFDFMLDDNYKVYLIEVNTNPCLETTCPILHKIITDVVDSGFRLALDPLFPPPTFQKRMSQQIPLTLYELCYDSKLDDKEMDEIYLEYDKKQAVADEVKRQGTNCSKDDGEILDEDDKDDFDEELLKEEEPDVYE